MHVVHAELRETVTRGTARMSHWGDGFVRGCPEMETSIGRAQRELVSNGTQAARPGDRGVAAATVTRTASCVDTSSVGRHRGFDSNLSTTRTVKGVQTVGRFDSTAVCYDVRSSSSSSLS